MLIAGREISCGAQPFLIGECGINHGGDFGRAEAMVLRAMEAGCDAVKFQTYTTEAFCRPDDPMFDTFKQCELKEHTWPMIKEFCDHAGIIFLSTPQNPSDLDILLKVGIPAIKVGSDDACNHEMLRYCASKELPTILSTGMSELGDIKEATWQFDDYGRQMCDLALLVCTSQYPVISTEANLSRITALRCEVELPVGFSDHTIGNTASIAATALGACVIEKHFTLSHDLPGPDHKWSMDPPEMRSWVKSVREAHEMMGDGRLELSEKEREQKRKYQRTHVGLRGAG